jgi:hypothetical protein
MRAALYARVSTHDQQTLGRTSVRRILAAG